jgi:hypothetical protein
MNSRQYEKMMNEAREITLAQANITEYKTVCLSADRTQYEVTFNDGSTKFISSGFEYFED